MTNKEYIKYLEEVIKIYERNDKLATETSIAYNELLEENEKLKSEYEKECKRADELEDSYWKSEKENKKLKELLKECKDTMNKAGYLFAKIDEVLNDQRLC